MGIGHPARSMRKTIPLAFHPPFDWSGLLAFLSPRAILGVEHVAPGELRRSLRLGHQSGWIRISHVEGQLQLESNLNLTQAALQARRVLDLDAEPSQFTAAFESDPTLHALLRRWPGIRVPGSWDPFEMGVRAILGQQISVRAAHTLAGRIVERWGQPLSSPFPEVRSLFPQPQHLIHAGVDQIASIGLPRRRAETLYSFSQWSATDPQSRGPLLHLPGIGKWTESYLLMRSSPDRDAFPAGDLGIHKALNLPTPGKPPATKAAEARSQAWRPWRSYAVFLLWRSLSES